MSKLEQYVTQEMEKLNGLGYPMIVDYKPEAIARRAFRAAIELAAQRLHDAREFEWADEIRALGGDDE